METAEERKAGRRRLWALLLVAAGQGLILSRIIDGVALIFPTMTEHDLGMIIGVVSSILGLIDIRLVTRSRA